MSNEIMTTTHTDNAVAGFASAASFDLIQRQAKVLAASDLVPKEFKGNIANCIIGLEIANRIGASPLAVLQNLYIVHGKPSWSSQFIIAALNSTNRFSPLRFSIEGEGDKKACIAWATEKATGERLESPPVSIDMAKKEGWFSKAGSKWQTMPDLMLRYRSATFFGRLYAPEIMMGMKTEDEVRDVVDVTPRTAELESRFAMVAGELPMTAAEVAEATPAVCDSCGGLLIEGQCHNEACDKGTPPE